VQVPTFFNRQVLLKAAFGANTVPSGTVTSVTNCALSQLEAVVGVGVLVGTTEVGAAEVGVGVVIGTAAARTIRGPTHNG
jgi:hypothetical protein